MISSKFIKIRGLSREFFLLGIFLFVGVVILGFFVSFLLIVLVGLEGSGGGFYFGGFLKYDLVGI